MSPPESSTSVSLPEEAKPHERSSSLVSLDRFGESVHMNPPMEFRNEARHHEHDETSATANFEGREPPPSAQPNKPAMSDVSDQRKDDELEEEEPNEDYDPAEKIDDLDWNELLHNYHQAMNQANDMESEIFREWNELMKFFQVWAEAGLNHETDRSFSRINTRTAYVQNSESRMEATRKHYTDVVNAFESALALLKNAGIPR
ncbi:unnamed protein product [Periconia digitata]|uniref:Uncharacterized protein n=1 Tax=Periconia digitata TaxID=1303443 RepID=A0A9W4XHJ1_9PLEO|nr:unnamed protein product [Periconia digitata]